MVQVERSGSAAGGGAHQQVAGGVGKGDGANDRYQFQPVGAGLFLPRVLHVQVWFLGFA